MNENTTKMRQRIHYLNLHDHSTLLSVHTLGEFILDGIMRRSNNNDYTDFCSDFRVHVYLMLHKQKPK